MHRNVLTRKHLRQVSRRKSSRDNLAEIKRIQARTASLRRSSQHDYEEIYHLQEGRYMKCRRCGAVYGRDHVLCAPKND